MKHYLSINKDDYINNLSTDNLVSYFKTNTINNYLNTNLNFNNPFSLNFWIYPYLIHNNDIIQNNKRMIIFSKLISLNYNNNINHGSYLHGIILTINYNLSPNIIDTSAISDIESYNYVSLFLYYNNKKYELKTPKLSLQNDWYNISLLYDGTNRIDSWSIYINKIKYTLNYESYINIKIPLDEQKNLQI